MCLLNDAKYIFQDKLLENLMDNDNKMNENVGKVLLLPTDLLEKGNEEEMMKY